jgi:hypothetical protein
VRRRRTKHLALDSLVDSVVGVRRSKCIYMLVGGQLSDNSCGAHNVHAFFSSVSLIVVNMHERMTCIIHRRLAPMAYNPKRP